ncbi:MAG: PBP1A family penicillin-binding protein [Clostridia bacterium]|nr:PBP1A family penicillin-binding protein [Clostridia bacterium]
MKDDKSAREILTKPYKKKMTPKDMLKKALIIILILGGVMVVGVTAYVLSILRDMPEIEETILQNYAISSEIYDQDGNLVASLHGVENRMPVELEEISDEAKATILSVEDKRFYNHIGIDPIRLMGAVVANVKDGFGAQGGSTLTQQLAKISFFDPTDISIKRKAQEAIVSLKMERAYEKDEILEMYLNKIYFGKGAYGIEAAAKTFFNVSASELDYHQSAVLAGVIQNPWANSPTNHPVNSGKRYKTVLMLMENNNVISKDEREKLLEDFEEFGFQLDLSFTGDSETRKYSSFLDNVFEEAINVLDIRDQEALIYSGGYKIYTSLDTKIQNKMEEVYADDTKFPKGKGDKVIQSAMIVIDPKTGEIKGLVGGRNQETARGFNRATQALRQPGSAFKPIAVFGAALEMGYTPASVFDDYPKAYPNYVNNEEKSIVFKNIDNRFRGLISMRKVLTDSINVCSVKALEEIGVENGFMFAQDLGITSLVGTGQVNDKGYSLALGGLTYGVSPLELTSAYSAFANGGIKMDTHSINKIENYYGELLYEHAPKESKVMSPQTAYLMTSMLQSAVAEGTGVKANFGNWPIAGKTGTTSFNADVWFVGYTPELIGGVWMGYDKEETMSYVYGGTHAAPIWREVMEVAHEGKTPTNFKMPGGIVSLTIDSKSGLLPSELTPAEYRRTEIFNEEFVPTEVSKAWISIPGVPPGVFLVREEPWQEAGFDVVPEDAVLEAPAYVNPIYQGENGLPLPGAQLPEFKINGEVTGTGSFKISWNWTSEKPDGLVFDIHRSNDPGFIPSPSSRIENIKGLSYTDNKIKENEKYYYKIIAFNNDTGTRIALSNTISNVASASNNEPKPPATENQDNTTNVPTPQLSISPKKEGDKYVMQLKWSLSESSGGGYEFLIFRGTEPGFPVSSSNQLNSNERVTGSSYSDKNVNKGTTYFYKVVTLQTGTNRSSSPSNEIRVGIPAE